MGYFKTKESEESYKQAKKRSGLTTSRKYEKSYYKNPKICKLCKEIIPYKKRSNKFCNHSCAASFNNIGMARNKSPKNYKIINNLVVKLKHFCICCGKEVGRNSKKYCSLKCQAEYTYLIFINKWQLGMQTGCNPSGGTSAHIKKYICRKYNNKCSCCGISTWNNKPLVLELEHIDGNSSNNLIANLCTLCPNCHSQTPTYKGANVGNGRSYRRSRYKEGKSY